MAGETLELNIQPNICVLTKKKRMNFNKKYILSLFLLISFSVLSQTDCWTTDITNTLNNPDVSDEVKDLISGADGWDLYEAMHKSGKSYDLLHNPNSYNFLQNLRNNDLISFESKLLNGLDTDQLLEFVNRSIPIEQSRAIDKHLNAFNSKSISGVLGEIGNPSFNFNRWENHIFETVERKTRKLVDLLDDFGYPNGKRAVSQRTSVGDTNKNLLPSDPTFNGNADEFYSFERRGVSYRRGTPPASPDETFKTYFARLKSLTYTDDTGKVIKVFNEFQSHHIFPVDLFKRESFRKWYELVGYQTYDFNGKNNNLENLIMLEQRGVGNIGENTGIYTHIGGVHDSHKTYTSEIGEWFDSKWEDFYQNTTVEVAADRMDDVVRNLSQKLKPQIRDLSVSGTVELNKIWSTQGGPLNINQLGNN